MAPPETYIPAEYLMRCGVDESTLSRISILGDLRADILEASVKTNLTRITGVESYWINHIADSLSIGLYFPELMTGNLSVVDVGCGGGFPILPLAWANPKLVITGLERRGKKTDFVRTEAMKLGLDNVSVVHAQAREHDCQYDCVLMRAVGKAWEMVRETRSLVGPGGKIIYYKTPASIDEDLPLVKREADKYSMEVSVTDTFELPGGAKRCFLVLSNDERTA